MRRREFIAALGASAIAGASGAHAQQRVLPVIGFLDGRSSDALGDRLRGFRLGLRDTGYLDGESVTIIYRWAENQIEKLPALSADLVNRHVAVIVASGGPHVALAVKAATTAIPVVFLSLRTPSGSDLSRAWPGRVET